MSTTPVERTQLGDAPDSLVLHIAGDHDDLARQAFVAQPGEHAVAVQLWHRQVEQEQLDAALADALQRLHAIGGLADLDRPLRRQGT